MKELLEVYTDSLEKTGEIVERGTIPKTGYVLTSGVIIENSNGEYLIQKTSKEKGSVFANTSGHVSFGETPVSCLIREVKEELGLDIDERELIFIEREKHPHFPLIFNFYYIKKDVDISDLTLQKEEVSYVVWMNKDEIKDKIRKREFKMTTANTLERFIL